VPGFLLPELLLPPRHDDQAGFICEIHHDPQAPALGSRAAEDQTGNPRKDDGAKAHGTGFESHIESRGPMSRQLPEGFRCLTDDDHLGVSGGVLPGFAIIVGAGEVSRRCGPEAPPDRNFRDRRSAGSFLDRRPHEGHVLILFIRRHDYNLRAAQEVYLSSRLRAAARGLKADSKVLRPR